MTKERRSLTGPSDQRDVPAVALLATGRSLESVTANVLRVREAGCVPFLVYRDGAKPEWLETVSQLDVETIAVPSSTSGTALERAVGRAVRDRGFPGVIYHGRQTKLDVDESLTGLDESTEYLVRGTDAAEADLDGEVVVAIPAYNEESTIGEVVTDAEQYVDEVVVVDDGSTDETARVADAAGATVIEQQYNRGYGAALETAFEFADAWDVQFLVTIDGDGQHDPADVPSLLAEWRESSADIVIGSRFVTDDSAEIPVRRAIGIHTINVATNTTFKLLSLGESVTDAQSGLRGYSRDAINLLSGTILGDGMGASVYILHFARDHGLKISETSVDVDYQVDDPNTIPPLRHGRRIMGTILRVVVWDRPIRILAIPGAVTLLLGIVFGYWTSINYLQTQTFPLGLALTTVFFTLVGVFSTFTGIILHSLNQLHLDR